MKYIKSYEAQEVKETQEELDIRYLTRVQGAGQISYIKEIIEYYKLTTEQIHNLKLAVDYHYLDRDDFTNVVNQIINSGYVWHYTESERKFKIAYATNFKSKIIKLKKPYQIGYLTWNKYKLDINQHHDLNSHDYNDIIGEIPKEYPFGKKYIIGRGRYRSEKDNKTLWETYKNTKRESEFIQVVDEKDIYILTQQDIENIEAIQSQNKYNL